MHRMWSILIGIGFLHIAPLKSAEMVPDGYQKVGSDDESIALSIVAPKSSEVGAHIAYKISVNNKGQRSIKYTDNPHVGSVSICVTFNQGVKKGKPVPYTLWGKAWLDWKAQTVRIGTAPSKTIPRGGSSTVELDLHRYFDLSWPGSYLVSVEWSGIDGDLSKTLKVSDISLLVKERTPANPE